MRGLSLGVVCVLGAVGCGVASAPGHTGARAGAAGGGGSEAQAAGSAASELPMAPSADERSAAAFLPTGNDVARVEAPGAFTRSDLGSGAEVPCRALEGEPQCLTMADDGVLAFGVDSGRFCRVTRVDPTVLEHHVSGQPCALALQGDDLLACGYYGEQGRPTMLRISLLDGAVEQAGPECMTVVEWGDGIAVVGESVGEGAVYESFEAFASSAPELAGLEMYASTAAADGTALYELWDGGPEGRGLFRSEVPDGNLEARSWPPQAVELRGAAPLLSQQTYVTGLDVMRDGRVVLMRSQEQAGLEVYDLETGERLAIHPRPADAGGGDFWGLRCDG